MDSFNITEVLTQDNIFILLDCVSDSYEHNKIMAYDILMAAPPQRLPFQVCTEPLCSAFTSLGI